MYTAILLVALVAGVSAQCVDEDANCPNWVENGICTNPLPFYFSTIAKCKKSCNLCGVPVANCGTNSAMAAGPCFADHTCQYMPGYGCTSVGNLCCPIVNTVDAKFQIGPSVGLMCPVGYTVVYGIPSDPSNNGVCIAINSKP